jgi:hypothetical protein
MTDDRHTIPGCTGFALFLVTVLLAASPALAVCGRDCRTLFRDNLRSCKATCTPGVAGRPCKQSCVAQRKSRMSACRIAASPTPPSCGQNPVTGSFTCTEVLGFSQTGMWFLPVAEGGGGTFLPLVGASTWQLRAAASAGVEWQDPNFAGWTDPLDLYSPCATNSSNPDRVLLTISVPKGLPTLNTWVTDILAEIATIRTKYSNLREIVLQPVVGGPNGNVCYFGGNQADPVHASEIHPTIDQAIARVVGGDVVAGDSPDVRTCADYMDDTGHLVPSARPAIGTAIGQFYVNFSQ